MTADHQWELDRFQRDIDYFQAHQEELFDQYPEQWVAIFDEQVVGADPDFDKLLADLRQRSVPVEKAFVEHLTRHEVVLIVPS